jgi:predicted transposase YbfD/YdcC
MAKADNTLAVFKEIISEHDISLPENGVPRKPVLKLIGLFQTVSDARVQGKVSYPLHEILMVAFLAVMAGAGTFVDIEMFGKINQKWLGEHFGVSHGIPSHDTFRRVFSVISPSHLQNATVSFLLDGIKLVKRAFNIEGSGIKHYCVDGKTARGTGKLRGLESGVKQMHTVHVYDRTDSICLVSKPAGDKTNEIPAVQGILKLLDLKGAVVTFDALNTQRDTVAAVIGQKGGYVAALKGNQPELFQEVSSFFTPKTLKSIESGGKNYLEFREKSHNRIEVRKFYLSQNVSWLVQLKDWDGLKSLIYYSLRTEDINSGKITDETYCYISSATDIVLCADAIRGHWSIENNLHWHLDVNFLEDATEILDRVAFQNMSLMNKMALSLLKLIAPLLKISIRSTRKRIGWDIDTLINAFRILDEDILAECALKVKAQA